MPKINLEKDCVPREYKVSHHPSASHAITLIQWSH